MLKLFKHDKRIVFTSFQRGKEVFFSLSPYSSLSTSLFHIICIGSGEGNGPKTGTQSSAMKKTPSNGEGIGGEKTAWPKDTVSQERGLMAEERAPMAY